MLHAGGAWAAGEAKLPVPRFVTLKSAEINVRTGPGMRYPIQWVYRREGLPVEVIEEFDHWRKIRDSEGAAGWVHKTMLAGARSVMIRGKEPRIMRAEPSDDAHPLLRAAPMVIASLMQCQNEWCRIQVSGRKGWIRKKEIWGVYDKEVIE